DLDKFKVINDTHGHPVGDSLLQAVAKRLSKITRQEDTIARIGGDEFILLLPQINHVADVTIVTERIMSDFQQPFNIDGHEFHVTASIGYAVYPDDGEDVDTLIKNSDIAMYIAKDRGRNRYQRFLSVQD
ncbi:MAG: GGDEF domain-containing protein, partial [Syntrophales bacterium LBB04]|nr:GGDEF domain-containing protein [Syntrophales bacterium LBB04]